MSFDLIVKTRSGFFPTDEESSSLRSRVEKVCGAVPGTQLTPSNLDPNFAKWFLENDAFPLDPGAKPAYVAFCEKNSISPDPLTPETAQKFWVEREGFDLVSVGLPTQNESDSRVLYAALVRFCKENDLVLSDPQAGRAVDLSSPEELPPGW